MRGPATVPSLVTCPTSTVVMPRSLASRVNPAETSRTWVTPPALPSASAVAMVCTESTMSSAGLTSSTCAMIAPRSVSAARYRCGTTASTRSARSRTWAVDSSPVTYSTSAPVRASCEATSSSRVDLPTPGSPASSTTAPATRPPPSTRSSSGTPLGVDCADSALTSLICRTVERGTTRPPVRRRVPAAAVTAATVLQPLQPPHRPTHFALCQPHSAHRYVSVALAMSNTVSKGSDNSPPPHRPQRRPPPRPHCVPTASPLRPHCVPTPSRLRLHPVPAAPPPRLPPAPSPPPHRPPPASPPRPHCVPTASPLRPHCAECAAEHLNPAI